MTPEALDSLDKPELIALTLAEQNRILTEQVATLTARVAALEARLMIPPKTDPAQDPRQFLAATVQG